VWDAWTDAQTDRWTGDLISLLLFLKKKKAVPLHAMDALVGRGGHERCGYYSAFRLRYNCVVLEECKVIVFS
jgi:hypothetical protein